jgi:hypothetical protein
MPYMSPASHPNRHAALLKNVSCSNRQAACKWVVLAASAVLCHSRQLTTAAHVPCHLFQGIYEFRGASPKHLSDSFKQWAGPQGATMWLRDNYRSRKAIVSSALHMLHGRWVAAQGCTRSACTIPTPHPLPPLHATATDMQ